MSAKNNLMINGYLFSTEDDAELAEIEKEKAEYFSGKVDINNEKSLLAVYNKLLDTKYFKTPVGWEYLKNIQNMLRKAGIEENLIRPIPLYAGFANKTSKVLESAHVRERIKPSERKKQRLSGFQLSVILNLLLVGLVAAMFAITIKSDNPNILNYKVAITDQYAAWEQELTEREAAVREKENKLDIEPVIEEKFFEND